MNCPQCGTAIEPHFQFCRDCGTELKSGSGQQTRTLRQQTRIELHFKILGWLLIGWAALTGTFSMIVFFAGVVVRRMPPDFGPDFGPVQLGFVTSIVWLAGLALLAVAGFSAAAGVGVFQYESWGRVMALIAMSFLMFSFPIGTAIGIYAFWVLLSAEGREHFKEHAPQPV